jgi:hypothetical protein
MDTGDGVGSEESLLFSASVVSGLFTQRYGLFLYVRTSSISILSNSNLGAVANDLTTLSLIFAS